MLIRRRRSSLVVVFCGLQAQAPSSSNTSRRKDPTKGGPCPVPPSSHLTCRIGNPIRWDVEANRMAGNRNRQIGLPCLKFTRPGRGLLFLSTNTLGWLTGSCSMSHGPCQRQSR
jgi:hypothetical protein